MKAGTGPCSIPLMPAALQRNWKLAEALYLQGVGPAKIAQDLDIPINTLNGRICRGKWVQRKQDVGQRVVADLQGRAQQWRVWAIDAADRFLNALRALPKSRVDKLSRQDVQSLRDVIEAGLRAYGLDKQGDQPLRLGVYIGGTGTQVVLKSAHGPTQAVAMQGPVIDCGCAPQAQGEGGQAETPAD